MHTCVHCLRQFGSREAVLMHVRAKHRAPVPVQQQPASHVRKAKEHACPRCTRTFHNATAVAAHVRDKHPPFTACQSVQHACPCCEQTFSTNTARVLHVQNEHPALECRACGASFRHADDLLRHHRYVHELVPCQYCRQLTSPLAHLQSVHGH